MRDPIETHGPIEIYYDSYADSPREDCNLGTFFTRLRSYHSPDEYDGGDNPPKDSISLPVYFYSHGNIAYSTSPFHCPWDSGQAGFIFVTKEKIREEYGYKRITAKRRQQIESYLKSEVETYSQWASGEVYGYVNTETDDSCWGYYSIEHALEDARH